MNQAGDGNHNKDGSTERAPEADPNPNDQEDQDITGAQMIGRYEIQGVLGQGNMGMVYKGFDPNLKRQVAIKTIKTRMGKNKADSQEFKNRFFLEAQANSQLNHPNIVAVYDSGVHDGEPFLVMEYIRGRPMDHYYDDLDNLDINARITMLEQIAMGLDYAHMKGVVHRDIKPANILVSEDFVLKIVDFGLARLKDSNLTSTGMFLGTPSYACPEQITSGKVEARSDLFSFGILAHELLTGGRPFPGDNINSILYHLVNSEPKFKFEKLNLEVGSDALEKVFIKALAKKPEERYPTALDFMKDLEQALGKDFSPNATQMGLSLMGRMAPPVAPQQDRSKDSMDETIVLGDSQAITGSALSQMSSKTKMLYAGVLAVVILTFAILLGGGGPEPPPPEPIQTNGSSESTGRVADRSTSTGDMSFPGMPSAETLEQEFQDAVNNQDVDEAHIALGIMESMGLNPAGQRQTFALLKERLAKQSREERESRLKANLQRRFKRAEETHDIRALEAAFEQFSRTFPQDRLVIDAWSKVVKSERAAHDAKEAAIRKRLSSALADFDTDQARQALADLAAIKSETSTDRRRVIELERNVMSNDLDMVLLRVEPGSFTMGDPSAADTEQAAFPHKVTLTKPFFMARTEVTQAQWNALMPKNPSRFKGDNLPVDNLDYEDALAFVEALNNKYGGNFYRLPTEAEWEYVCRAGTQTAFAFGEQVDVGQFNVKDSGFRATRPVGSYAANPWGFYDMHGNVSEWCRDMFTGYQKEDQVDPLIESGKVRILRGGSYADDLEEASSFYRKHRLRRGDMRGAGLRLVWQE